MESQYVLYCLLDTSGVFSKVTVRMIGSTDIYRLFLSDIVKKNRHVYIAMLISLERIFIWWCSSGYKPWNPRGHVHYSGVVWTPSLLIRLFVQELKEKSKPRIINPLWWDIMDSPHKGPVMLKASPCHDVIMDFVCSVNKKLCIYGKPT